MRPFGGGYGNNNGGGGGFGNRSGGGGGFGNNQGGGGSYGNNQGGGGGGGGFGNRGGGFGNNGGGGYGNNNNNGGGGGGGFGNRGGGGGGFGNNQGGGGGGYGNNSGGGGGFGNRGSGGFGNNSGGGGYGNNNSSQGGGGFGNRGGGGGGFGNNSGGGGFGNRTGGGGGGFGNNNNNQGGGNGGGFGNRGGGGFGNNGGGGGGGGFGNSGGSGGGGGFGNRSGGGGFGNSNNNQGGGGGGGGGFGNRTGGGGFGNNGGGGGGGGGFGNSGGGGFGNRSGGFGNNSGGGGGGFGNSGGGGGGFGNRSGGSGGFGNNGGGGGGFGNNGGGGGGFGNNNNNNNQGGGFGNRGGGFGNNGGGGFGNNNNNQQQQQQQQQQFANLPDFSDKPYGNMFIALPEPSEKELKKPPPQTADNLPMSIGVVPAAIVRPAPPPVLAQPITAAASSEALSASIFALKSTSTTTLKKAARADVSFGLGAAAAPADDSVATPARLLMSTSTVMPSAAKTPAPARDAPRCNRPDYVLKPSLAELQTMRPQQLRAVPNFEVWRADGKCSVKFLAPVNLTRVIVDEVLLLEPNGRVVFYPNDKTSPPPGEGLMVPALITVQGVANITKRELRSSNARHGQLFKSYDPALRTWSYFENPSDAQRHAATDITSSDEDDGDERGAAVSRAERTSSNSDDADGGVDASPVSVHDKSMLSPGALAAWGGITPGFVPAAPPAVPRQQAPAPLVAEQVQLPRQQPPTPAVSIPVAAMSPLPPTAVGATPAAHFGGASTQPELKATSTTVRGNALGARAAHIDVSLPYALPQRTTVRVRPEQAEVPRETQLQQPTIVLSCARSAAFAEVAGVALANRDALSRHPHKMLARSVRIGWSPHGQIAIPSFTRVVDGPSARPMADAPGVTVVVRRPLPPPSEQWKAVAAAVLAFLLPPAGAADAASGAPTVSSTLRLSDRKGCLSADRLDALVEEVRRRQAAAPARKDDQWANSVHQLISAISLASALFAFPERDPKFPSVAEESTYIEQLRRRLLMAWIEKEVRHETAMFPTPAGASKHAQIQDALLVRDVRRAASLCEDPQDKELRLIIQMSGGEGNVVGDILRRNYKLDGAPRGILDSDRDRLIKLLGGVTEPFVEEPSFAPSSGERAARAVSWKRLLGLFAFYAVRPEETARGIVSEFAGRLTSRQEGALPTYAAAMPSDFATTSRGKDFLARGTRHRDSLLHVLTAFSSSAGISPAALHPHASSYFAHDHLVGFILSVIFRGLDYPATPAFAAEEHHVIVSFAEQLAAAKLWHLGLFVLCHVSDPSLRAVAIRNYASRFARHAASIDLNAGDIAKFLDFVGAQDELGRVECERSSQRTNPPQNAPSLETHASIMRLFKAFA